jgi:hypothetical protein
MANYHQVKNAAILTPTESTDLGSDANRYSNVFMSGNILMSNGVTVTSSNAITPRITSITYPGSATAVIPAGGETISITGSGFSNQGSLPTILIGSTPVASVTYNSSTSMSFVTPLKSAGTYVLYVINADGGTATYVPGISVSGTPAWTTASGSLGSVGSAASASFTVSATSDSTITYSVTTGSLPTGLTLNSSTGAITGTMPSFASATTYNFTITAIDAENQATARAFSINGVLSPSTVDYLVVAGAGGGGGYYYSGGGGAGGLLQATGFSVSGGVTYTITIGAGGANGATQTTGTPGSNSVFSSITTYGGGGGAGVNGNGNTVANQNGGSGGGGLTDQVNVGGKGVYPGSTYISATRQGYDGGSSSSGGAGGASGGGGGAGAVGGSASGTTGGNGGIGSLQTMTVSFVGTATTNSTTTLNITAVSAGEILVGTQVTGTGIPAGAYITALGTGTGGTGTYIMNAAATASASGVAITSSGRYFAGGGGGQSFQGINGRGGAGGGGAGAQYSPNNTIGGTGATNTGSGGGGGSHNAGNNAQYGGSGGSGVVIIRYSDAYPAAITATNVASGYPVTGDGYRIYKWNSSGTIAW